MNALPTESGRRLRAGVIEAPEIGLPDGPASAMYALDADRAEDADVLAPEAVPRMTLTSSDVSSGSIQ